MPASLLPNILSTAFLWVTAEAAEKRELGSQWHTGAVSGRQPAGVEAVGRRCVAKLEEKEV